MEGIDPEQLLSALRTAQWPADHLAQLHASVAGTRDPGACLALIEQAAAGRGCPRCGCSRVHRCGQANSLQPFLCLGCRRSDNALAGTPLARLRKRGHWLTCLQCVLHSRTVSKAAEITGVHCTTSFRWRHRLVPAAAPDWTAQLSTVVEADETCLLASQRCARDTRRPARRRGGRAPYRGIGRAPDCLLVLCDRDGHALDFHTGGGPVTARHLASFLRPVIADDALLISDWTTSYCRFAHDAGIRHAGFHASAGESRCGELHLQPVDGWHARFKGWLLRFRGVASRYVVHYSGWQRVLGAGCLTLPPQLLLVAARPGQWGNEPQERAYSQKKSPLRERAEVYFLWRR